MYYSIVYTYYKLPKYHHSLWWQFCSEKSIKVVFFDNKCHTLNILWYFIENMYVMFNLNRITPDRLESSHNPTWKTNLYDRSHFYCMLWYIWNRECHSYLDILFSLDSNDKLFASVRSILLFESMRLL